MGHATLDAIKDAGLSESMMLDLLASALDREPVGIAVLRPDGDDFRYVYVNPAYQAFRPSRTMLARAFTDVWPELTDPDTFGLRRVLDSGEERVVEDQPLEVEGEDARRETRYYTHHTSRIQTDGDTYLLTTSIDVGRDVAIREELQSVTALLDAIPAPIAYIDSHLVYLRCNAAAGRALGRPCDEIVGHPLHEVVGRGSRVFQGIAGVLRSGRASSQVVEFEVAGEPERRATYSFSYVPDKDADGVVRGVFAEGFDVSQQIRTLRESEERYRAFVQATSDIVYRMSPDWSEMRQVRGRGFIVGARQPNAKWMQEFVHPDDRETVLAEIREAIRTKGLYELEHRVLWPNGTQGWIVSRAIPLLDDNGQIVEWLGTARDITDRKRLEEQVSLDRQRFQALVDTLPIAVFVTDLRGGIVYTNEHVREIWGGSAPDGTAADWSAYRGWWPDTREPVRPKEWPGARALEGETVLAQAIDIERFDGKRATILNSSAPIRDSNGEIIGQVTVEQDITEQRRSARLAEALNEIDRVIHATLELEELARFSLAEAGRAVGADSAVLLMSEDGAWVFRGQYNLPDEVLGVRIPRADVPFTEEIVRTQEPMVVGDMATDPRVGPVIARAFSPVRSFVLTPLVVRGSVVGFLGLDFNAPHSFLPSELEFARKLASSASLAIQNAELFDAEQLALRQASQELRTTSLLLEAADALSDWTDIDGLLSALGETTLRATEHRRVAISMLTEDGAGLYVATSVGEAALPIGMVAPRETLSSVLNQVLDERRTMVIDYDALPEQERGTAGSGFALHLALAVPLVFGDQVLGAIGIDDPGERHEFSEREIRLVEGIASQASVAIENALLFDAQRESARYAEALNRINEAVHSTLEFDEIMSRVVDETASALEVDGVVLHLRRPGAWKVAYARGLPREPNVTDLTDRQAPLSMVVERTRHPVVIQDVETDPRAEGSYLATLGVKAVLGVPLLLRDEVLGVFFAARASRSGTFAPAQLDFTGKVGATVSLALENARLYQNEHTVAQALQAALLALPDTVPGVRFAHAYHSASEAAYVGGDFYDIFELEHDRIGVLIGDVAGKGLEAAVLTSLLKNTIRAHAAEPVKTPERILALTNDIVYKQTSTEAYATVFFGILECATGRFVYSNAGHTTTAIVRTDGRVLKLPSNGPILGAFPTGDFSESEARLESDEMLFMYTDGLTEARRDSELFGEDRLFELLSLTCDGEPSSVIAQVLDAVEEFSGGRLRDDLAILGVERLEHAEAPSSRELGV